jgi:hypothetical protein
MWKSVIDGFKRTFESVGYMIVKFKNGEEKE